MHLNLTRRPRQGLPPLFLIGVARSGTSWLGQAIGHAPRVRFYYEPDNIDADPTGSRPAGRQGFGPYPMIEPGERATPFASLWDTVVAGRMPAVEDGPLLGPARLLLRVPRAVRDPLVRGVAATAARIPARGRRTAVKSIYAIFSLDWLVERYHPRVLVLQRNPLNVVSSWRQLDIPVFDLASRPRIRERYLDPLGIRPPGENAGRLATIAWHVGLLTHVLGEACDRHPDWRLITHEDLCGDPVSRIREVFDAVDLTWSVEVERYLDSANRPGEGLKPVRVTTEQPERWRWRLTPDEIDEIHAVLSQFPNRGWVRAPATVAA